MPLVNDLNTNQVKDAAGSEVEFEHLDQEGRSRRFKAKNAVPARPHILRVDHSESGTGIARTRRSRVGVAKVVISDVDNQTPVAIEVNVTAKVPVGALNSTTEIQNAIAEALSFCASDGSSTLILYNCTGSGAKALVDGTL